MRHRCFAAFSRLALFSTVDKTYNRLNLLTGRCPVLLNFFLTSTLGHLN